MTSSNFQVLHQSLNQLKSSKLMGNEIFRELYDEARGHETIVNLNNLTTGAKKLDEKLTQETNFYLILAKMLNELSNRNQNEAEFRMNLEKIHKWYLKNRSSSTKIDKRLLNREVKTSTKAAKMQEDKQSFIVSNERELSPPSSLSYDKNRMKRELSPVYFPTLNNRHNQITSASKPHKPINKANKDLISQRPMKSTNQHQAVTSKVSSERIEMDEQTKQEFLQAITSYASQFYSNLNDYNTRRLKSNLKSLSKFYDTLSQKDNTVESEITLQSLVEMAKDVSDRMVLSKAKMNMRINEKKQLLESFRVAKNEAHELIEQSLKPQQYDQQIDEGDDKSISVANSSIEGTNQSPQYSVTIVERKSRRRPKSTSYLDWRGQTSSRPSSSTTTTTTTMTMTTNRRRIRSEMKFTQPPPSCTSPISISRMNDVIINSNNSNNNNSNNNNIVIANNSSEIKPTATQTMKSSRPSSRMKSGSLSRALRSASSTTTTAAKEPKEVKFVSFVTPQKLVDMSSSKDEKDAAAVSYEEANRETTKQDEFPKIADMDRPNSIVTPPTSALTAQSMPSDCVRDDVILCECCIYRPMSNISSIKPPNNSRNDIFHLTETSHTAEYLYEENNQITRDASTLPSHLNVPSTTPIGPKVGLKDILLSNYDKTLANKIGIKDFMPIELLRQNSKEDKNQNDDSDVDDGGLEFIPFERIEQRYPREYGMPVFDPNRDKPTKKLYRTNPSIPRPESKYGTRAHVYEQIIELKKQQQHRQLRQSQHKAINGSKELVVWQPEDFHLVRDLLQLEHKPLTEILKIDQLKVDAYGDEGNVPGDRSTTINTRITTFGRPINSSPQKRWRQFLPELWQRVDSTEIDSKQIKPTGQEEDYDDDSDDLEYESKLDQDLANDSVRKEPIFKLTGSSILQSIQQQGRPIPTFQVVEDPVKHNEEFERYVEAKNNVHIPSIFKGSVFRNYSKEFGLEGRLKREESRLAAIKIQRKYRRHLRDKRFIENRPPLKPEMVEWARQYKTMLRRRKEGKHVLLADEQTRLRVEHEKFKNYISRIGIHVDLYKLLHRKGPEYTNKVLNQAATCIQRWVRGWLIRKEMNKLRTTIESEGGKWIEFTRRYRKTILRIRKMRNCQFYEFDFKPKEALEFYQKEKKFTAYFEMFAFNNEIEFGDVEKMLNFLDYYPNHDEIEDAKMNVLKYYKRKVNSTSMEKRAMFDIIYYIYPPAASKLKSTRKSTWLSPVVDGEDALRLKGFKLLEPANFGKAWRLLALHSRQSTHIHKTTPEL